MDVDVDGSHAWEINIADGSCKRGGVGVVAVPYISVCGGVCDYFFYLFTIWIESRSVTRGTLTRSVNALPNG